MKVYDTLSQNQVEFVPVEDNKVKMYVCGPTVYDDSHLGHARCYITWDTVVRYLRFKGYDVTYVRNITDVDDKIISRAKETNSTPEEIAEKYYKEFKQAMYDLNVADPDIEPKATDNIQEMIDIIKILIDKGFAYNKGGNVYFRVNKYIKYGTLSKQNMEDLKIGARIEVSEEKENPLDFVLWKACKLNEEIGWESHWGKGRPGWHTECSAMVKKYLGNTIDIHAGGQDLIFPHHENEKAQSEAANGEIFTKYWLHNGFVIINKEKMSKSLGNFVTIRDVLDKYDANTIRFFILTNHYRMPVEFTDEALKSAKAGVRRIKNTIDDIKNLAPQEKINEAENILNIIIDEIAKTGHLPFHKIDFMQYLEETIPEEQLDNIVKLLRLFINAMDDDFNTAKALACIFEISSRAQKVKESEHPENCAFCLVLLLKLCDILGFDILKSEQASDEMVSQLMDLIISIRKTSREQKTWEISDKIRDELIKAGIALKDHKDGTTSWNFSE